MKDNLDIQGHRGCRGLLPENTIPGMIRAIDLGVNTLEMDVCVSKDSVVVLSHEPFFDHKISTAPDGSAVTEQNEHDLNIYQMDYAEVKSYDVGLKDHPWFPIQRKIPSYKPALSSLIDTVQNYIKLHNLAQPQYSIEMKYREDMEHKYHPDRATFVDLTVQVIQSTGIAEHCILQCFDAETLNVLHAKHPEIKTAYLIENQESLEDNMAKLQFVPTVYSPNYKLVDAKMLAQCQEKNMLLIPWTINEEKDLMKIIQLGVDGVISDYPDKAIEIYEGLKLGK